MRIGIAGSAGVGKSTLFEAFKLRWPMYSYPTTTYRDLLKEQGLTHSSNTTEETQLVILDWMLQEQEKYPKDSKVIFDRCTYDNLVYTLQANQNDQVSDPVCAAVISLVRESLKNLDIIFWIKRDERIPIVDDGRRDVNKKFIEEIDQIYQDLMHQYSDNLESDAFFPLNDCPAVIQVEGIDLDSRLAFISEFIDRNGNLIETETSILDPQNLDILEQMIKDQEGQKVSEDQLNAVMKKLKY